MRRPSEDEIEEAVDAVMDEINEHEFAGAEVLRSVAIEFYEAIIARCRETADSVREELEAEGEARESESDDEG